jgi:hypothetical protein
MNTKDFAEVVSKAIFLASILTSIGSVEMSSKFSVLNFSKDQLTLQRAADALRSFIIIGVIWTIGSTLSLYASHGWVGIWAGLFSSSIMLAWIILSYVKAFRDAAKEHGLQEPTVLNPSDWTVLIIGSIALSSLAWWKLK